MSARWTARARHLRDGRTETEIVLRLWRFHFQIYYLTGGR